MTTPTEDPSLTPRRRSLVVRLLRFVAWVGVVIGALALAATVAAYGPCFAGVPDRCVSGIGLLFGGVLVLLFGGVGALTLFFTRARPGGVGGG